MASNETGPGSDTAVENPAASVAPPSSLVKEENNADERASSPDPSCPICLDNVTDAAYTDMCCHRFCFNCLVSWSRVKPECPLCKQRFKFIIHNVRSIGDYDELPVTWVEPPPPTLDANVFISLALQRPRPGYRRRRLFGPPSIPSSNILYVPSTSNLSSLLPPIHSTESTPRVYRPGVGWGWRLHDVLGSGPSSTPSSSIIEPASSNLSDTRSPPSSIYSSSSSGSYMNGLEWRRRRQISAGELRSYIYRVNQWVCPHRPRPGVPYRIRECSPSFYRNNPAQVNRLVPWLQRELLVLLDVGYDCDSVCQRILQAIKTVPIRSNRFQAILWPYLQDRTAHFIHEFYNFATSPYDLMNYDLRSEYVRRSPGYHEPLLPSEPENNSDSSEVEIIEAPPPAAPELIEISDDDDVIRVDDRDNESDASVEIIGTMPPLALRDPEVIDLLDDSSSASDVQATLNSGSISNSSNDTLMGLNVPDLPMNVGYYSCPSVDRRERVGRNRPYYKDDSSSTDEEEFRRRPLKKRRRKLEPPKKRYKRDYHMLERLLGDSSSSDVSLDQELQERLHPSSSRDTNICNSEHRETRSRAKFKISSEDLSKFNGNKSSSSSSSLSSSSSGSPSIEEMSSTAKRKKNISQPSTSHRDRSKFLEDSKGSNPVKIESTPAYNDVSSPPPETFPSQNQSQLDNKANLLDYKWSKHIADSDLNQDNCQRRENSNCRSPSPKPRLKSVVKKIEPNQEAGCSTWPLHNLRQRKFTKYNYTHYFSTSDSDS